MRELLKRAFRGMGFVVRRASYYTEPERRLARQIQQHSINLLLDVGANTGQFAQSLFSAGYTGRIVSFEPLSAAHAKLKENSAAFSNWSVAERMAIGSASGKARIHIAGNSASSSLLPMLQAHLSAAPHSAYVGEEEVAVQTLDAAANPFIRPEDRVFIKIDVQGLQREVLAGASELLKRARGLLIELAFVPMYEGEQTAVPILQEMHQLGFLLWDFDMVLIDEGNARPIAGDAVLFRTNGGDEAR